MEVKKDMCKNCSILDREIDFESKMQDEFEKELKNNYFESLSEME